jgi:hypothetical protein
MLPNVLHIVDVLTPTCNSNNKHIRLDNPLCILASHNPWDHRENIHKWDYTWSIFEIRNPPQPIVLKIMAHSHLHLSWVVLYPNIKNFVDEKLHGSSPHLDKVALHMPAPSRYTGRNVGICNHSICDYMRLCVICDYFCNYLPTSSNLGRICDYASTNVQLLSFSSSFVNVSRIIFIHD